MSATQLAVGDVNGDGFVDLVLAAPAGVPQLLLNRGAAATSTSQFKAATSTGTSSSLTPTGLVLASFTGAGQPDLLATQNLASGVLLYAGQPVPVIRIGFTNVTASVTGSSIATAVTPAIRST